MDAFCDEEAFTWFLSNATRINQRNMTETGEAMNPPIPIPVPVPVPVPVAMSNANGNTNTNTNEEIPLHLSRENSYIPPSFHDSYTSHGTTSTTDRMQFPGIQKLQQFNPANASTTLSSSSKNSNVNNANPGLSNYTAGSENMGPSNVQSNDGHMNASNGSHYGKSSIETISNHTSMNAINLETRRYRNKNDIQREKEEKLERRRARNRASARASRTRRLTREDDLCKKLKIYENENYDLKMRLKIGKDALSEEKKEKKQCIDAMMTLLKESRHTHRNNEAEIQQLINLYKHSYAEYGAKKKEKIGYHLKKIRQLLLPTGITNISFLSVEEGKGIIKIEDTNNSGTISECFDDKSQINNNGKEKISISRENLWEILVKELGVTEEQQKEILSHQPRIQQIKSELQVSLDILNRLKDVTEQKNIALDKQIQSLQNILTPTQTSKFIIWIKQNPAFMYMLDKLVSSTIGVGAFKRENVNNVDNKTAANVTQ